MRLPLSRYPAGLRLAPALRLVTDGSRTRLLLARSIAPLDPLRPLVPRVAALRLQRLDDMKKGKGCTHAAREARSLSTARSSSAAGASTSAPGRGGRASAPRARPGSATAGSIETAEDPFVGAWATVERLFRQRCQLSIGPLVRRAEASTDTVSSLDDLDMPRLVALAAQHRVKLRLTELQIESLRARLDKAQRRHLPPHTPLSFLSLLLIGGQGSELSERKISQARGHAPLPALPWGHLHSRPAAVPPALAPPLFRRPLLRRCTAGPCSAAVPPTLAPPLFRRPLPRRCTSDPCSAAVPPQVLGGVEQRASSRVLKKTLKDLESMVRSKYGEEVLNDPGVYSVDNLNERQLKEVAERVRSPFSRGMRSRLFTGRWRPPVKEKGCRRASDGGGEGLGLPPGWAPDLAGLIAPSSPPDYCGRGASDPAQGRAGERCPGWTLGGGL